MPRRNHNVNTSRARVAVDQLSKRDARRIAAKAGRKGRAA